VGRRPDLEFPTGGSARGSEKWSAGLSGVVLAQPGDWTLGLLANNLWSYAGADDRDAVNKGLLQYFVVYQLGQGWYLNSAPIITVNWESEQDGWIVPFVPAWASWSSWASCPSTRRWAPTTTQ